MVNSIKLFGFGNLEFPKIQYLYKHAKEWVSFVLLLKRGICAVPAKQEIYVSYVLALIKIHNIDHCFHSLVLGNYKTQTVARH